MDGSVAGRAEVSQLAVCKAEGSDDLANGWMDVQITVTRLFSTPADELLDTRPRKACTSFWRLEGWTAGQDDKAIDSTDQNCGSAAACHND